tara:strand:- start:1279 stop:1509 length:231 start_codon:yes stop_codon:yes gene_type:complete
MEINQYKDIRGIVIEVGDYVMYGKSCRHTPVSLGTVQSIGEEGIKVLGDGCKNEGLLRGYNIPNRVLILPDDYRNY